MAPNINLIGIDLALIRQQFYQAERLHRFSTQPLQVHIKRVQQENQLLSLNHT